MAGTYDNEMYNEFTTLSHDISEPSDITGFASSWNYGPCKNGRNRASENRVDDSTHAYHYCQSLFVEQSSEFRPCFGQVSKHIFMCY